jgi:hypothetical protein
VSRPEDARDPEEEAAAEDEVAPTPFDNPFFLPVILAAFALWLGYDGFLNPEFLASHEKPDQRWVVAFNQWGAGVCALLAAWFGRKAVQERRAQRKSAADSQSATAD